jgi:methionyl-tRNA formyltransferase
VGVVTQPDRARGRGQKVTDAPVKAAAVAAGLPIIQPVTLKTPDVYTSLEAWRPDLGVVAAYGQLIPRDLLALPRLGMINVHASLLPKYRGAAPVHRAVIAGDAETGVTIMRVAPKLDAGAMFARVAHPIGPDDTSEAVEDALAHLGAALLVDVVDQMAIGTAHEEPQDDARATYAARLTKDEGVIDWRLPAARIHDQVRGLYPWPHAFTYLDGQRVILWTTRVLGATGAEPGTVLQADKDGLLVAAGERSSLAILEIQSEGRRPMTARDFLQGHPVAAGARFTRP